MYHQHRAAAASFLFGIGLSLALGASCALAQGLAAARPMVRLAIQLQAENGQSLPLNLSIRISSPAYTASPVVPDLRGNAVFPAIPVGYYLIEVRGTGVLQVSPNTVDVEEGRSLPLVVRLHLSGDSSGTVLSAAALAVPDKARKELRKALDLLARGDLQNAQQHCRRALEIHAPYAAAYNVLGVIATRRTDFQEARADFLEAVHIDPGNGEANLNLGRLALMAGDWTEAQRRARRSLLSNPKEPATLTLLAVAQLKLGQCDAAVLSARQAHELAPLDDPSTHLLAGSCLQHQNLVRDAILEYNTFLREMPAAGNAADVRRTVAELESQATAADDKGLDKKRGRLR